jgi:hypothetical protein
MFIRVPRDFLRKNQGEYIFNPLGFHYGMFWPGYEWPLLAACCSHKSKSLELPTVTFNLLFRGIALDRCKLISHYADQ